MTGTVLFATARELAWHKLGQNVDGASTTKEAIEMAGLNYEVEKIPLYMKVGNETIEVPKKFATYRKDTNIPLGVVGEKYEILQNTEAFSFFDELIERNEAYLDSAGVLTDGARIYITAKIPKHNNILGDDDLIDQHIIITTSHDGNTGTSVVFAPVRMISQNVLNFTMKNAKNKLSIKHTSNQMERLNQSHKIINLEKAYTSEFNEIIEKMVNTKLTDEILERIIVCGMADNASNVKRYYDSNASQSTRFRNNVESAITYALTHPTQLKDSCRGTVFGAVNAISSFFQNEFDWRGNYENKMESIIEGRIFKKNAQALDEAMRYIK